MIDSRADRGIPRDTHGDLHLDHVYLFPEKPPPDNLSIIDCIEFNDRFRYADPVSDTAFLVMDLKFHGRPVLARTFAAAYFEAVNDHEGRALLPYYTAYRAIVRGKVEGLELRETEIPAAEKAAALARAKAHWLLALSELEEPRRRPCLVLVGGLPGTAKTTLARELAQTANFSVIRSDVVRKELADLPSDSPSPAELRVTLYSEQATERTYSECLHRARTLLELGHRVVVDASFREDSHRNRFLNAAKQLCVPGLWLECRAEPEVIRRRLETRRHDASDADWSVSTRIAEHWTLPGTATRPAFHAIETSGSLDQAVVAAEQALSNRDLL